MKVHDITTTQGDCALFSIPRTDEALVYILSRCAQYSLMHALYVRLGKGGNGFSTAREVGIPSGQADGMWLPLALQSAGVAMLKLVRSRHYCHVAGGDDHGLDNEFVNCGT